MQPLKAVVPPQQAAHPLFNAEKPTVEVSRLGKAGMEGKAFKNVEAGVRLWSLSPHVSLGIEYEGR